MPSYKLIYYNGRGRAENIRMMFALAGVEFEDYRMKDREEFLKLQPELPTSQVPVLKIDNKITLSQSYAIARYLASEFGFYGKDNLEKAQVDMVVDTVEDMLQVYIKIHFEKDENKKAELKKEAHTEKVPRFLKNFEKILTANGGGNGFIVGNSVTLADVSLANILWASQREAAKEGGDFFANNPKLKAHMERVHGLPKIAEWIKKRPESEF